MLKRGLRLIFRLIIGYLLVVFVMVVTQDLQVFPGMNLAFWRNKERNPLTLPAGVESSSIVTRDGEILEVWSLTGVHGAVLSGKAALVFHGNAGTVAEFFSVQLWLQSLGVDSYALDYRGYGNSTGWPSESGLYLDALAAWNFVLQERRTLSAKDLIIVGVSIGTGPAAFLASTKNPAALVLFSPFTSLTDAARAQPFFGHLAPLLLAKFPAGRFISMLTETAVIASHGFKDSVIPYQHSLELEKAYRGKAGFFKIISPIAGHNDVFGFTADEVGERLVGVLGRK